MAKSRTKKLGLGKAGKTKADFAPSKGSKLAPGKVSGLGKDALNLQPGEPLGQAIATLAASIRTLQEEDGSESVDARVEIGQRLKEVRERLPHGAWLSFLTQEVGYAYRTAQRLIHLGEWAPQHPRMISRVRGWGPTKVYHVMDAGPALAKRLLSRKRHTPPGSGQLKLLDRMSATELKGVLGAMRRGGSAPEEAAPDGTEEVLRKLERDSKKVMKWTNQLAPLDAVDKEERLATVRRRLLRCQKRLEETMTGVL